MSDRPESALSKEEKRELKKKKNEPIQGGGEEEVVQEAIPSTASSTSTTSVPTDHKPGEGDKNTSSRCTLSPDFYLGSLRTMTFVTIIYCDDVLIHLDFEQSL
jgi:hypothetical protein